MQFNSFSYILVLLPLTVVAYFLANKINYTVGKCVLIVSSIIFYTNFEWRNVAVLGISLVINYLFAYGIYKSNRWNKLFMLIPIVINVLLLLYFKYTNFAITNINSLFGKELALKELILPLGISFFTFQQVAYVVAVYRKEIAGNSLIDYLVYILYFPKVLMGPLMDPVDFVKQINDSELKKAKADNIAYGIKIFSFGLFKKLMIADVFAGAVNWGYSNIDTATAMDWFLISIFYTFEIYFDFSGYSDMAVGSSIMCNITLPINFDSPYKALSIRDFWKRWHISLTSFFTKYIYIPLGGSRKGLGITCLNTMIVFLISGIWHGANWTFIVWGVIHGLFMIIDRLCDKVEKKLPMILRWFVSFNIVNVLWLLFRSDSLLQWKGLLKTILLMQDKTVSDGLMRAFVLPEAIFFQDTLHLNSIANNINGFWMIVYLSLAFIVCLVPDNNYKKLKSLSIVSIFMAVIAFVWGVICLGNESVFVYFNF